MGMRLGGYANTDRVTRDDFDGLAIDLGMSARALVRLASSLVERIEASFDGVANLLLESGSDQLELLVSRVREGFMARHTQVPRSS
jgi:hypothetical protein